MRKLIVLLLILTFITLWAEAILNPLAVHAQESSPVPFACDLKGGPKMVTRGALLYFRGVLDDALNDEKSSIELYSDWLCYLPRHAQPFAIMVAENLLYFVYEVLPSSGSQEG